MSSDEATECDRDAGAPRGGVGGDLGYIGSTELSVCLDFADNRRSLVAFDLGWTNCWGMCGLGGISAELGDGPPGTKFRRLGRLALERSRSTLDLCSEDWSAFCGMLTEEDFQDLRMDFLAPRSFSSFSGTAGATLGVVGRAAVVGRRTG